MIATANPSPEGQRCHILTCGLLHTSPLWGGRSPAPQGAGDRVGVTERKAPIDSEYRCMRKTPHPLRPAERRAKRPPHNGEVSRRLASAYALSLITRPPALAPGAGP